MKMLEHVRIDIRHTIAAFKSKHIRFYDERFAPDPNEEIKKMLCCVSGNNDDGLDLSECEPYSDIYGNTFTAEEFAEELNKEIAEAFTSKLKGKTYFEMKCEQIIGKTALFTIVEFISDDERYS